MEDAFKKAKGLKFMPEEWLSGEWKKLKEEDSKYDEMTGIPVDRVRQLGQQIAKLPEEYSFHP